MAGNKIYFYCLFSTKNSTGFGACDFNSHFVDHFRICLLCPSPVSICVPLILNQRRTVDTRKFRGLRKFGYLLNSFVPSPLGRFFYVLNYTVFRALAIRSFPTLQLWSRNSYDQNNYEPFVSDIDFTLFVPSDEDLERIPKIIGFHRKWKERNPILGEVNIYYPRAMALIARSINCWELARDANLEMRLHREVKTHLREREAGKLVFLVRCLESDCQQIKGPNSKRAKKWNRHFSDVLNMNAFMEPSTEAVLERISQMLPAKERSEFIRQLAQFYELKTTGQIFDLESQLEESPWLFSCFANHYCYTEKKIPTLTTFQQEILLNQIQWEIFAALTQHFNFPVGFFDQHLINCRQLLEKISWETSLVSLKNQVAEDLAQTGILVRSLGAVASKT